MPITVVAAEIKPNKTYMILVYGNFTFERQKQKIVSNCEKYYAWNKKGVKIDYVLGEFGETHLRQIRQ